MRTFIGIAPDDAAGGSLAACGQELAPLLGPRFRWIAPANLHLTLAFLGEVHASQRPVLSGLLREILIDRPEFELQLDRLIYIPGRRRARVLAWHIHPHPALLALYGDLSAALTAQGLATPDRRFLPHLSIARIRAAREPPAPLPHRPPIPMSVRALCLFASRLDPGGAQYTVLDRVELTCARSTGG